MSVPATLLLIQVTRGMSTGGSGLPPEDKRTEKEKRRDRRLLITLAVFCALLMFGLIGYCLYSMNK